MMRVLGQFVLNPPTTIRSSVPVHSPDDHLPTQSKCTIDLSSLSSKTTQRRALIYTNKQGFTLHIDPMFQYFFITSLYTL